MFKNALDKKLIFTVVLNLWVLLFLFLKWLIINQIAYSLKWGFWQSYEKY